MMAWPPLAVRWALDLAVRVAIKWSWDITDKSVWIAVNVVGWIVRCWGAWCTRWWCFARFQDAVLNYEIFGCVHCLLVGAWLARSVLVFLGKRWLLHQHQSLWCVRSILTLLSSCLVAWRPMLLLSRSRVHLRCLILPIDLPILHRLPYCVLSRTCDRNLISSLPRWFLLLGLLLLITLRGLSSSSLLRICSRSALTLYGLVLTWSTFMSV